MMIIHSHRQYVRVKINFIDHIKVHQNRDQTNVNEIFDTQFSIHCTLKASLATPAITITQRIVLQNCMTSQVESLKQQLRPELI